MLVLTQPGGSYPDAHIAPSEGETRDTEGMSALRFITTANAALYLIASLLHTGVSAEIGPMRLGFAAPSPPATIAEGLIGLALAAAAVSLFRSVGPSRWVWAAYVFALAGTLLGTTIIVRTQVGGPDLLVHVFMLAGLAVGYALLASLRGRTRST